MTVDSARGTDDLQFQSTEIHTIAPDHSAGDDHPDLCPISLASVMSAVQETAYEWNIASGEIAWAENVHSVLGFDRENMISTAGGWQLHIAREHAQERFDIIAGSNENDTGAGVPYRIQYQVLPNGRRGRLLVWVEDQGIWYAGPDGRPSVARGLVRVIDQRKEDERELFYLDEHDEVSGQRNRGYLFRMLGRAIQNAVTEEKTYALILVGIDDLADINKTFGIDVGDQVLETVGERLAALLRQGDIIGRYASDIFGILVADADPESLDIVVNRLIKSVHRRTIETVATPLCCKISSSAVYIPEHGATVEDITARALVALDRARSKRAGDHVVFEPDLTLDNGFIENVQTARSTVSALDENRMKIALQPIVDSQTSQMAFCECLVRMEKLDGTHLTAGEFVPLAEQLGLSHRIDKHVLRLVCGLLRDHQELNLSLNISSLTTLDHDWIKILNDLTDGKRSVTERLIIEITETAAIHDLNATVNFVDVLKDLGCRVAIDDFGAGYTSFKNLKFLGADMVKIDGTFITNLSNDPSDYVFVQKLAELAQHFGLKTVAECVGDTQTVDILKTIGIDYLQGYLYGRPTLLPDSVCGLD